eukprot:COSAG04_NODE_1198_length_7778_cov_17.966402_2_plen_599_part_00
MVNKGYEGEDNALYCLTPGNPLRKLCVAVCDPGGTLRTELQSETQSQWAQRAKTAGATEQEIEECEGADDALSAFYRLLKPTDWFDYATLTVIVMSSVALALDRPHNASTQLEGAGSDLEDPLVVFNLFVTLFFLVEFVIKVIAYGFCFAPRGYIMDPWNAMDLVVLLISIFDAIMTLQEKGTNEWTRILRLLRILRPLRMIKHAEGMKVIVNALIACGPMVLAVMVLNAMFYVIFATLGVGLFKGQFFSCDIEVLDWGSVGGQLPTPGPNDEICTSSEDCRIVAAGSSVDGFYTEIVRYDPCLNVKSRVTQVPEPGIRLKVYTVATSPMCEYFIQFCIIVNTGVMVAEHFPEDASLSEAFCNANLAFLIIFTLEAAVKIFALGLAEYLQDNWYRLDIVIVTSSWLFMLLAGGTCASGALRSLRVLRIVLLLKSAPNLNADGSRSPGSPRSSRREPSPFAQTLDDENWFNRLIFELGAKPKDVHADVTVGFHELLLALTLLQHSYEGLAYKDAKKKEMEMERRAQEYAAHVITAFVRCRRVCREAAVGWTDSLGRTYDSAGRVEAFQKAAWCARTMLVDSAVRTNKIAKASEVLILNA